MVGLSVIDVCVCLLNRINLLHLKESMNSSKNVRRSIEIESNIQDYQAQFVSAFAESLKSDLEQPSAVILDANVSQIYQKTLAPLLKNQVVYLLDATEDNKSLASAEKIIVYLIEHGVKRNYQLIGIGGGITQDITCFIASTLFRGIQWVLYPTTLLAQCDSCIGSKSSINVGLFKNQMGTFYPPQKVIIDVNFLQTLEEQDVLSGLGEAIKVHYLDEERRFQQIFDHYQRALSDPDVMEQVIYDSLVIKKRVIEIDEYDRDYRNIMNYGHTFGHAIESVTNYVVPHGIAVTFGIGLANYMSWQMGFLSEDDYQKMNTLVKENTKQHQFFIESLDDYWNALRKDKKNIDDRVNFILTKGFGKMFKHRVPLVETSQTIIVDYLKQIGAVA